MRKQNEDRLTIEARRTLLRVAREAIRSETENTPFHPPEIPCELERPAGAFVTLKCGEQLRGCIGTLEAAAPLWETVEQAARQAATLDYRFDPVHPEELPKIRVEVSVLSPLERLPEPRTPRAIRIGTDGLCIRYRDRSGVLLPQVAVERGWSAPEFLEHLCRKAELPPDRWADPDAELFRFTAEVFDEQSFGMEY